MRRLASALLAASMAGGCMSGAPKDINGNVSSWDRRSVREARGVQGPYGERIPMSAAARNVPSGGIPMVMGPNGEWMLAGGTPTPASKQAPTIQQAAYVEPANPGGVQQANFGPIAGLRHNHPIQGPGPGFGGPGGPGGPDPGAMAGANALPRFPAQRTQVRFVRPSGMRVAWFTQLADGRGAYSQNPIDAPGRYNFPQGAIYRLKLSNIEGRPGLEVYPTMEIFPTCPKTESFLAHSAVPVEFTPEDFKSISEGSYVVKVIYLPDPAFQDVASTGTEEILSTRLEPGVDPIQEAIRRGSILAVIRMGNVDQEAPNSPPLNSVAPGGGGPGMNPIMNFGPTVSPPSPNSMVPFGPGGMGPGGLPGGGIPPGPGPMPPIGPQMISAPTPLPPTIAASPLPKANPPVVATPVSRPGVATAISPPDAAVVPATPPASIAPQLPIIPALPTASPESLPGPSLR